jgi:hypothetical protein
MDVPHKGQKIVFLFAEYRLVAVLEEVAGAAMAPVEILRKQVRSFRMTAEMPLAPLLNRIWTWLSIKTQA